MNQADEEYSYLLKEMDIWEKAFNHKKPCQEYKKTGWCLHLANAQHRKFKPQIRKHFDNLI